LAALDRIGVVLELQFWKFSFLFFTKQNKNLYFISQFSPQVFSDEFLADPEK